MKKTIYVKKLCSCLLFCVGAVCCSHDFIGEFTTSYRELSRGQNQFNVYEVRHNMEMACYFIPPSSYKDLAYPI